MSAVCPDCGGPVTLLYRRYEFDPPMATVWCDRTGVSKALPLSDYDSKEDR